MEEHDVGSCIEGGSVLEADEADAFEHALVDEAHACFEASRAIHSSVVSGHMLTIEGAVHKLRDIEDVYGLDRVSVTAGAVRVIIPFGSPEAAHHRRLTGGPCRAGRRVWERLGDRPMGSAAAWLVGAFLCWVVAMYFNAWAMEFHTFEMDTWMVFTHAVWSSYPLIVQHMYS